MRTNSAVKRLGSLTLFLAALLAGGCLTEDRSFAVDVDARSWSTPATFTLPNADTATRCDLQFFLRCDECLAGDTVTFRIAVTTPGRLRFEELFATTVPRTQSPAALLRERIVPYRRAVRLAETGDYRISIAPLRPLKGVEAVGLNIVKSE